MPLSKLSVSEVMQPLFYELKFVRLFASAFASSNSGEPSRNG
jgi:hypothetical protein